MFPANERQAIAKVLATVPNDQTKLVIVNHFDLMFRLMSEGYSDRMSNAFAKRCGIPPEEMAE